ENRAEERLLAVETGLEGALLRQVVDDAGEVAIAGDRVLADRQMHGEDRAVPPQPVHLASDPDDTAHASCQVALEVLVVLAGERLRHHHRYIAAGELLGAVADLPFGRLIDGLDQPLAVDRDDAGYG